MKILYAVIFTFVLLSGCTDNETSARKLYNEAMTLQQNGNTEQAISIYKKIVAEYPGTETAVDVNKQLSAVMALQGVANALNKSTESYKSATKEADDKLKNIHQQDIAATLDMFKLDNGRYPSTEEGLHALIVAPDGLRHWNGPYYSKGTNTDFLDEFDYQYNENTHRYSLQMK